MSETANYSWKNSNFIERRFFQKMNLSGVKYLKGTKLTNCSSKCSYISENLRENTRGNANKKIVSQQQNLQRQHI